jgi:hypothetical protein
VPAGDDRPRGFPGCRRWGSIVDGGAALYWRLPVLRVWQVRRDPEQRTMTDGGSAHPGAGARARRHGRDAAEHIATEIYDAVHENVATKTDLRATEGALRADLQAHRGGANGGSVGRGGGSTGDGGRPAQRVAGRGSRPENLDGLVVRTGRGNRQRRGDDISFSRPGRERTLICKEKRVRLRNLGRPQSRAGRLHALAALVALVARRVNGGNAR